MWARSQIPELTRRAKQEFFTRLDRAGVLVRKRMSTRNPADVTGYAVALASDTGQGGPVWFGGGKLAVDLTWPKLRRRWEPSCNGPAGRFTSAERNAIREHAAKTVSSAATRIRSLTAADPTAAADAAWAAADTLHVAAAALGSRVLRQAADSYDRAARAPYGRIPRPTAIGNSLREVARLLATTGAVTDDSALMLVTLVTRLTALADVVAELRSAQRHAAQAAARQAAERLNATYGHVTAPTRESLRARPLTAAQQARLDAPALRLIPRPSSMPGALGPQRPAAHNPRKTRGPTR
jgi:hypothetical protein